MKLQRNKVLTSLSMEWKEIRGWLQETAGRPSSGTCTLSPRNQPIAFLRITPTTGNVDKVAPSIHPSSNRLSIIAGGGGGSTDSLDGVTAEARCSRCALLVLLLHKRRLSQNAPKMRFSRRRLVCPSSGCLQRASLSACTRSRATCGPTASCFGKSSLSVSPSNRQQSVGLIRRRST